MRALQYDVFGDAVEVLKLVDLPEPGAPGPGEVQVAVLYAPLNHHDLLTIAGTKKPNPALPAVAGNEGLGRVVATGPGVGNVEPGDIVVLPLLLGTWRERMTAPAHGLTPLPDGDLQQFSMLGSNTPTAGLALSEYVPLAKGDWVAQSSGNGGVGRNLIALAKARGFRTASLVRRPELVDELHAAGADVVVVDGPHAAAEIASATGNAPIRLAVEGVGGRVADELLGLLAPGGTLLRYAARDEIDQDGSAAARGIHIDRLSVAGFDYATKIVPVIAEAVPLIESGALRVPVEAVYGLDEIRTAIAHLKRGGKIILRVPDQGQRPA
ncbi:zinc-dependent alcohol dehydrogenase family protein [Actinoplanes sp. TBRC 11911]|uniref:zinc-dependent alcohol dehydrogenase family protein n=1 Tax=Actinoplanes sp. TBRC 11911 TaxID=2729386 RepID=UPI00145EFA4C|nr:zinc-dependent alcohol dehydrogenase family protein [Actinoplanes sp. TBRC 11911]NMO55711.1 zinc-dependent alcohol dehydrogenase family protein [Actinoplanes sp. TBRC 11911]